MKPQLAPNTRIEGHPDRTVIVFSAGNDSATWTGTHRAALTMAWLLLRCTIIGMWRGFWRA